MHGRAAEAAVHAGVASNLATMHHLFASGALSSWRWTSGTFSLRPDLTHRVRDRVVRSAHPHVFSSTLSVGGHTRMVWRWMKLDAGRTHSVAVTRQGGGPVPP